MDACIVGLYNSLYYRTGEVNEMGPRDDPCGMSPFKKSHCEHGKCLIAQTFGVLWGSCWYCCPLRRSTPQTAILGTWMCVFKPSVDNIKIMSKKKNKTKSEEIGKQCSWWNNASWPISDEYSKSRFLNFCLAGATTYDADEETVDEDSLTQPPSKKKSGGDALSRQRRKHGKYLNRFPKAWINT